MNDDVKIPLLVILCFNTCNTCECEEDSIKTVHNDDLVEIRKILEAESKKTLDRCECRVDNTVRDNEPPRRNDVASTGDNTYE